jgi:hypothetical protein
MVMVAGRDHHLASREGVVQVLGELVDGFERVADRRLAQLGHVAEHHEPVDLGGGLEEPLAHRRDAEEVVSRHRPEMEVGYDSGAHDAIISAVSLSPQ